MHTAALTADHRVYTWGVNDEGALGRETGAPVEGSALCFPSGLRLLSSSAATYISAPTAAGWLARACGCAARLRPLALPLPAAGELWEKSGEASGKPGDAYTPGLVALPKEAGRVLQLSAGGAARCQGAAVCCCVLQAGRRSPVGWLAAGPHMPSPL